MYKKKIKISDCCGAVMVNDNWCPCCDRFTNPVEDKKIDKDNEESEL